MKSRKDGMCFEEAVGAAVQAKSTDGLQNLQPPWEKAQQDKNHKIGPLCNTNKHDKKRKRASRSLNRPPRRGTEAVHVRD